ncbi:MAG: tyrosine-type recombinase/integrase [Lachnospiraceae bacterium]|nr:tyrosine-type recombinase/integrase [Lachnospiraceae bacterium]
MTDDSAIRKSIVAPYINGLLNEKHANGYSYASEELILNRFDSYCIDRGLDTLEISKEFLSGWMERNEAEGEFNHGKRISCIRQLLLFMATCGIKVYVPHDFCHFTKALPHIFEPEEISDFFSVVDSYTPQSNDPAITRLSYEYRLIFRWYCCCGLRNSEAACIASENVDLIDGVLTIIDSKGNKDRLVYLPDDLCDSTAAYYKYLTNVLGYEPKWFFPGGDPQKPLPNTSIDRIFNRFWKMTRFARCNNKPTVHDFRFTYVVNRMNRWSEEGLDLQVMMPYLSRYLGHKSTSETFYYYCLVKDAYKTVEKKDSIANDVIPEVRKYE